MSDAVVGKLMKRQAAVSNDFMINFLQRPDLLLARCLPMIISQSIRHWHACPINNAHNGSVSALPVQSAWSARSTLILALIYDGLEIRFLHNLLGGSGVEMSFICQGIFAFTCVEMLVGFPSGDI